MKLICPLVAPTMFLRDKSFKRSIQRLISTPRPPVKEYVQSTGLDNCLIPASTAEQYVDLALDHQMIAQWVKEGYSHLHLGAVRIILTLHGRKGLPFTARLALLNSIYCKYDQAVIGTSITTLHADSICLTFYPNFNIPLADPNICKFLKIKVQISGISMVPGYHLMIKGKIYTVRGTVATIGSHRISVLMYRILHRRQAQSILR
ncbi:hypothetical protein ACOSQ4_009453 [Xanthoceras sorbifolium]